MKKSLIVSLALAACVTLGFAEDNATEANATAVETNATAEVASAEFSGDVEKGAVVFKKCIACHGPKAEKSYLNKIPVLTTLDPNEMVENMKKYKAGELNLFKMGAVMKGQMASLSEEDMVNVTAYIMTLK